MLEECLRNVRQKHPLIHCITNYVTVNDVANVLLAAGGSPIMADAVEEAAEITAVCSGLVINIGTLNAATIPAMYAAGKKAAELRHPIVLDPVGAGASALRTKTALDLMAQIPFSVIRGNISEIKTIASTAAGVNAGGTQGVDAALSDAVTEDNLHEAAAFIAEFARCHHCIAAVTGRIDIVSDGAVCYAVTNGRAEMSRITGTGCQLSALTAAFIAANPDNQLEAVLTAVCMMGLCGELAFERLGAQAGNASYRTAIIDTIYALGEQALSGGARYALL